MQAAKIFLVVIFMITLSFGVRAQDKYEYATVMQSPFTDRKGSLYICTGDKYEEQEIKITEGSLFKNVSPLIAQVNKMSLEGWEVYANNFASGTNGFVYYLRKKKG